MRAFRSAAQTVLLKGVNDDVETMKELMQRLLLMRVRPYYLYQCDPISRLGAFPHVGRKPGLDIIDGLRGHTTGYARADLRDRRAGRRRQDSAAAATTWSAATATT